MVVAAGVRRADATASSSRTRFPPSIGWPNACIESIYDLVVRRRIAKPLETSFLSVPTRSTIEPWRGLAAANTPGPLPPDVPLFLAQGEADQLVEPAVTRDYFARSCRAGVKVRYLDMPRVGHG